jgi:hypothetical protein
MKRGSPKYARAFGYGGTDMGLLREQLWQSLNLPTPE